MRLRRKVDAALTLLLATALCLLLYSQREQGAPAAGLPNTQARMLTVPVPLPLPTRPGWGPEVVRAFPEAGAEHPVYEADTPAPPTPSGPFDFRRYLQDKDKRRFPLLINQPQKCKGLPGGPGPDLLIAVKSVAADFERREVVRKTWGAEGHVRGARVRRVFLLGIPRGPAGARAQAQEGLLRAEGRAYRDILLWAFDDTFFNLTLKEIHFLDWASTFCSDARFVFKGDDDVFVHVENLLEFVATRDPARDLLAGDVILQARPIRARDSKYYIPEGVYGLGAYPAYAGGGGFVLSGATLRRLAAACAQVELFPIDDVFLGMCLQRLRLAPEAHQAFRTFGIAQPSAAPHLRTFDPCFYRELVLVHGLSAADIWLMWQMLHAVPGPDCARSLPVPKPFRWGS